MTSLIFWGPYLAHKGYIGHKREKQRLKNYERWEGLRDEYDDQRRITRESRSLDIQRTGVWDPMTQQMTGATSFDDSDRPVFTMRDQQEANDARTGWRPQEAWENPRTQMQAQMTGQVQQIPQPTGHPQAQRHVSSTPAVPSRLPLQSQKTGATWDEGLPAPLNVSRRSFDDYDYGRYGGRLSVSGSENGSRRESRQASVSRTHTPSGLRQSVPVEPQMQPLTKERSPEFVQTVQELPKNEFGFVDTGAVARMNVAGGRMAELIERGY